MDRLSAMDVFVRVAETGSFTAVADHLGLARSMVTRQVSALEAHLGVKLIARSTRSLKLTAEGEVYLERCREILGLVGAAEGDLSGELAVSSWETLTSSPTTRLTFYSPDAHVEEFAHTVERIGLHGVNYAVGFTAWLDVAPAGVSKASALQGVRDRLGIAPTRTIGVGDQRNDLEMLQWAACGVAMGNAPAEVKAVADLVTGHVADDGLADVLRALVPAR